MSEFVDSFLKAAAQKTTTFIKDTTAFISRIREVNLDNSEDIYLVTLDVKSLYTNIDHEEGIAACEHFLNLRMNQTFPTRILTRLIRMILQSHTMQFLGRFFHQIKGTAMGTSMAVNFANLFMAKLETEMLNAYEAEHGTRPLLWIRYIDDVFCLWRGSETSLQHFIAFVDSYTTSKGMKSNIRYSHEYSKRSATFLDTKVIMEGDALYTDLYVKDTAAFDYLHRSSYHPQHTIKAIPKGQFIRIRRICSKIEDYNRHAAAFIQHFVKRGYNETALRNTATTVASTPRDTLLQYNTTRQKSDRIPLVITYHHKLKPVTSIIHQNYTKMINDNPTMKDIFPEPPVVSFRRPSNLSNILVRANHVVRKSYDVKSSRSRLDPLMNHSGSITNVQTGTTKRIKGGNATDKNSIYAAECTKHNLICVGYSSQQTNQRFNLHRTEIASNARTCELVRHFADNNCDFDRDLRVSILDTVSGSTTNREFHEDKWITRLNTRAPNGINSRLSGFARLYYDLFD